MNEILKEGIKKMNEQGDIPQTAQKLLIFGTGVLKSGFDNSPEIMKLIRSLVKKYGFAKVDASKPLSQPAKKTVFIRMAEFDHGGHPHATHTYVIREYSQLTQVLNDIMRHEPQVGSLHLLHEHKHPVHSHSVPSMSPQAMEQSMGRRMSPTNVGQQD